MLSPLTEFAQLRRAVMRALFPMAPYLEPL